MRAESRPMSVGTTWSVRYDATASSRPLSVASPTPVTPSAVVSLRVTKLRSGQVTMTRASAMGPLTALLLLNVQALRRPKITRAHAARVHHELLQDHGRIDHPKPKHVYARRVDHVGRAREVHVVG